MPNPKAYQCVKKVLKEICEVKFWASIAPLMQCVETPKAQALADEFVSQLVAYSRREYPFTDPLGSESVLEWWKELELHPKACILVGLEEVLPLAPNPRH